MTSSSPSENLRVELESTGADIDDEVEFTIHNGEVLGLVGESASGKTTAATALLVHERRGAIVSPAARSFSRARTSWS